MKTLQRIFKIQTGSKWIWAFSETRIFYCLISAEPYRQQPKIENQNRLVYVRQQNYPQQHNTLISYSELPD